ncbi:MAG: hypothetical protein LCH86_07625 [Proteobacteria bacterium]|nr:hypothetical protein [Pseudomonadota bacterium]
MAILKRERDRLSTGAPMPPPVWQMLCEFANGSCICATTDADQPCTSVATAAERIRSRALLDAATSRRRPSPPSGSAAERGTDCDPKRGR